VKKETWKTIRQWFAVCALVILLMGTTFELANTVMAQTTGYRFTDRGLVFQGQNGGVFFEPSFLAGPDSALQRIQPGNIGFTLGGANAGWATLSPPAVAATMSNAASGGTIPTGTYRGAPVYVTITGGLVPFTATGENTTTTGGGNLNTLTMNSPIAEAGAAGWIPYWSVAGGATLTELSQAVSATVCAGAFNVNGPAGPATGLLVCPIGTNATITSLTTTPTIFTPNIPGQAPIFQNGGIAIPSQNTAAYPAAIPETICNYDAQTPNTTITTIQVMATCPMIANVQNSNGKLLHVTGHIVYTTAGAPIITISLLEGGITPIAVSGVATTGAATNGQVSFDYYVTTVSNGSAGTLESHGLLYVQNNTALGTALGVYADQNTAVSSAINLSVANNLGINITATVALSTATLRDAQVVLLN
jgi:hypothetical protein